MTATATMLRSLALASLLALGFGPHAEAQSRDAGARDAGRTADAPDDDDDDVIYLDDDEDTSDAEDEADIESDVRVAGGGVGCALPESGDATAGSATGALLLLGLLVARRRR